MTQSSAASTLADRGRPSTADLCAAIATPENLLFRFQCSPFHVATALHPVITHLEAVLGFNTTLSPEEKLDRIEQLICGQHGLPREDVRQAANTLLQQIVAHGLHDTPRLRRSGTKSV